MQLTIYSICCTLYLVLQIFSLIPLSLFYMPRWTRPHPSFTLHQTLGRKLLYDLMSFYTRIRLVTDLPLDADNLGKRFLCIPPSSRPGVYRGPLDDAQIKPTTVSGTWYPHGVDISSIATAARDRRLLLHFHGGGYVLGSGRPLDSGYMGAALSRHVAPLALFAEYRLSCSAEGRFPAALQDALSSYLFLLDQGVHSGDIILSGDSAGGHLVISLLRYIHEYMDADIPTPRCALLWSPWIDVAQAAAAESVARRPNYRTDYLPAAFAQWAVASFAPSAAVDLDSPYVTLLHKPFKSETKMWVHVGALELLYDEVEEWVQQMREAGCGMCLRVEGGATHDIVESGYLNGFRKQGEEAVEEAASWIKMYFSDSKIPF